MLDLTSDPRVEWSAATAMQDIPAEPIPPALPSLWVWPVEEGRFAPGAPGGFTSPRSDAHWVRFGSDGRSERGRYRVASGTDENTLLTEPDTVAVMERRSGCGAEDGDLAIPASRHPSGYTWSIGHTPDGAEVLEIKCSPEPRERNRWQFLLCHWAFEFRSLFSRARE